MAKQKSPKRDKKRNGIRKGLLAPSDKPTLWDLVRSKRFCFLAAFIFSCIGIYAFILALPYHFTELINEDSARYSGASSKSDRRPCVSCGGYCRRARLCITDHPRMHCCLHGRPVPLLHHLLSRDCPAESSRSCNGNPCFVSG